MVRLPLPQSCKDCRGWGCLFDWGENDQLSIILIKHCVLNIITFTIIKSINIKNSIIRVINIIIFTIINSINIKNSIICVINIVEPRGALFCCVFLSRIAARGIISSTKSYWVWLSIHAQNTFKRSQQC